MRSFYVWYLPHIGKKKPPKFKGTIPCHMSMGDFPGMWSLIMLPSWPGFATIIILWVSSFNPTARAPSTGISLESADQSRDVGFTKFRKNDWSRSASSTVPVDWVLVTSPAFLHPPGILSPNTKISHQANLYKIPKNKEQKDVFRSSSSILPFQS